jgi:hypothetical protein
MAGRFYRVGCKDYLQGTQLAYQLGTMKSLLTPLALGALGFGAWHFSNYRNAKRKRSLTQQKIEVWEGEGGAVPVHKTRTAQQVSPVRRQRVSPGGDG